MGFTYRNVGSEEDYLKKAREALNPQLQQGKTSINAMSDEQKKAVTDTYNGQIDDTAIAYEDSYRENAVQKLINEREVAENMANLGLTNSGLNRTQQTAVQLSYANNKANIDRQKQAAVDSLARSLAAELSGIETSRISAIADLENDYNKLAMENATTWRQADLDYNIEQKQIEADSLTDSSNKKETIIKYSYGTPVNMTYSSNGNVIYTDESGNSLETRAGANPYTGEVNSDLLVNGKYDASRAFSNGYQPKFYKGKKLEIYEPEEKSEQTSKATPPWRKDGKQQNIFTTGEDKYYVWYGKENRYVEAQWSSSEKLWKFNIE